MRASSLLARLAALLSAGLAFAVQDAGGPALGAGPLSLHPPLGVRILYELDSRGLNSATLLGRDTVTEMLVTAEFEVEALERHADGGVRFAVHFGHMRMRFLSSVEPPMEYDSRDPGRKLTSLAEAALVLLAARVGRTLHVETDARAKVLSVEGYLELLQGTSFEKVARLMGRPLVSAELVPLLQDLFALLPETEAAPRVGFTLPMEFDAGSQHFGVEAEGWGLAAGPGASCWSFAGVHGRRDYDGTSSEPEMLAGQAVDLEDASVVGHSEVSLSDGLSIRHVTEWEYTCRRETAFASSKMSTWTFGRSEVRRR